MERDWKLQDGFAEAAIILIDSPETPPRSSEVLESDGAKWALNDQGYICWWSDEEGRWYEWYGDPDPPLPPSVLLVKGKSRKGVSDSAFEVRRTYSLLIRVIVAIVVLGILVAGWVALQRQEAHERKMDCIEDAGGDLSRVERCLNL